MMGLQIASVQKLRISGRMLSTVTSGTQLSGLLILIAEARIRNKPFQDEHGMVARLNEKERVSL
jgi:hypothetical protein